MVPKSLQTLIDNVRTGPAATDSELRQATVDYARALTLNQTGSADSDLPTAPYLQKVVKHAYKIVDRDISTLKESGWNEDEIFELTVAAALGTSLARLEQGYALLEGRE